MSSSNNKNQEYSVEEYFNSESFNNFRGTESLIIKCLSGCCAVIFKGIELNIQSGDNFFIPQFIRFEILECTPDFHAKIVRLSDTFMIDVYPYLSSDFKSVLGMATPNTYRFCNQQLLDNCVSQMEILGNEKHLYYGKKISVNIVTNYLLIAYEQLRFKVFNIVLSEKNRTFDLANRFFQLLNEDIVERQSVKYFAEKLNVSPRYLYNICKANTGLTPKQLIDFQTIGYIKKLLLTSDESIAQISDRLNFPDQASLGQFFKRNTSMSPLEYRKKL